MKQLKFDDETLRKIQSIANGLFQEYGISHRRTNDCLIAECWVESVCYELKRRGLLEVNYVRELNNLDKGSIDDL